MIGIGIGFQTHKSFIQFPFVIWETGRFTNATGDFYNVPEGTRSRNYIPVNEGQQYKVSDDGVDIGCKVFYYDDNKELSHYLNTSIAITIPSGIYYIRVETDSTVVSTLPNPILERIL